MKKKGLRGKYFMHDTVEDLMDLKSKLGCYMWSNHRVGSASISSRLDRFLINSSLIDGQSLVSTKILPTVTSDHHLISLLFEREEELGPIPFRFSPLQIDRVGFFDVVSQAWSQYIVGSPSFVREQKLKNTKIALK